MWSAIAVSGLQWSFLKCHCSPGAAMELHEATRIRRVWFIESRGILLIVWQLPFSHVYFFMYVEQYVSGSCQTPNSPLCKCHKANTSNSRHYCAKNIRNLQRCMHAMEWIIYVYMIHEFNMIIWMIIGILTVFIFYFNRLFLCESILNCFKCV